MYGSLPEYGQVQWMWIEVPKVISLGDFIKDYPNISYQLSFHVGNEVFIFTQDGESVWGGESAYFIKNATLSAKLNGYIVSKGLVSAKFTDATLLEDMARFVIGDHAELVVWRRYKVEL